MGLLLDCCRWGNCTQWEEGMRLGGGKKGQDDKDADTKAHLKVLSCRKRSLKSYPLYVFPAANFSWNTVALWHWVAKDDTCGICRMPFDGCCPDCKVPGDDCPLGLLKT